MKIEFEHLPEPSITDIEHMWKEIEVEPIQPQNSAIKNILTDIRRSHKRGGAEFFCFKLSPHPVLRWFGSLDRLLDIDFFSKILMHPTIFDELNRANIVFDAQPSFTYFDSFDAFTFDGLLARILAYGGAYRREKSEGTDKKAKRLSIEFCQAVFEQRYSEVQIYYSPESWNSWFPGPDRPWNHSFFGLDKRTCTLWMLFVADID